MLPFFCIFKSMELEYQRWIVLFLLVLFASCTTTEKIADGRTAYERKRYAQAIQYLLPEYESTRQNPAKAEIAYLLGDSYDHIGYYRDAKKWFYEAYNHEYGLQALLRYADVSKKVGDYKEAEAAYTLLANETNDHNRFQKYIMGAVNAQDWMEEAQNQSHLKVENLSEFNTPQSEVLNQVFGERNFLFSSDRDDSEGRNYYAWTGRKFFDIYELLNGTIHSFDDLPVNTELHESDATFDESKTVFAFTRCASLEDEYDVFCKIYVTRQDEEGNWTEPEVLPFSQAEVNFMHPFLSPDGNRIYFSSDIDKNAKGYDLFYTDWDGEEWSDPEIMNQSQINTEYDELFPTLYKDTLYFSSDRPGGMGGLDIYKTWEVNGQYVIPQNVLPPINSSYDDFKYLPFKSSRSRVIRSAYFTSNRPGGAGGDDLYEFRHEREGPDVPVDLVEEEEYVSILEIRTVTRKDFSGSGEIVRFPLEEVEVKMQGTIDTLMHTNMNGEVRIENLTSQPLSVYFMKEGYFSYKENISKSKLKNPDTVGQEIIYRYSRLMDPIIKDVEIVLENIYYDYDRWNIRPDARPILDSLANLLEDNPHIVKIEMTSHTDCRGTEEYNIDLSQKRAESAVQYLISAGIAEERLSARGYGKSQPVIDCVCEECSEEEHQANRRTAFRIIE